MPPTETPLLALTKRDCVSWTQGVIRRVVKRSKAAGTGNESDDRLESTVIGLLQEHGIDPTNPKERPRCNTSKDIFDLAMELREKIRAAQNQPQTEPPATASINTLPARKTTRPAPPLQPAFISPETREQILAGFKPHAVISRRLTTALLGNPEGIATQTLAETLGIREKLIQANVYAINRDHLAPFGLKAVLRAKKVLIIAASSLAPAAPEATTTTLPAEPTETTTAETTASILPEETPAIPAPPEPQAATPPESPDTIAATIRADALTLIARAQKMLEAATAMAPETLTIRAGLFKEGPKPGKEQEEAQIPHYQQITRNILGNKELSVEEKAETIFELSMNLKRSDLNNLALTILELLYDYLQKANSIKPALNKTVSKIARIKSLLNQNTEREEIYLAEILTDSSTPEDTRERALISLTYILKRRGEYAKALEYAQEKLRLEQKRAKQTPGDEINITFATRGSILKLERMVRDDKSPEGKLPEIKFFEEALEYPELDIEYRIKAHLKLAMLYRQLDLQQTCKYGFEAIQLQLKHAETDAETSFSEVLKILGRATRQSLTADAPTQPTEPLPPSAPEQPATMPPAAAAAALPPLSQPPTPPAPEPSAVTKRLPASLQESIEAQHSGNLELAIEIMERLLAQQEKLDADQHSRLKSGQRIRNLQLALRIVNEGQPAISKLDRDKHRYMARHLRDAGYATLADQCDGQPTPAPTAATPTHQPHQPAASASPLSAPTPPAPEKAPDLRATFLEWTTYVENLSRTGKWPTEDGCLLIPGQRQAEIQGKLEKMLGEGNIEKLYVDYYSATSNNALRNMVEKKLVQDLRVGKIRLGLLQQLKKALEAI